MIITINKAQLESLAKAGLLSRKITQCSFAEKEGDFKDRYGNPVIRTTIFVPEQQSELMPAKEYLHTLRQSQRPAQDDLDKEMAGKNTPGGNASHGN